MHVCIHMYVKSIHMVQLKTLNTAIEKECLQVQVNVEKDRSGCCSLGEMSIHSWQSTDEKLLLPSLLHESCADKRSDII